MKNKGGGFGVDADSGDTEATTHNGSTKDEKLFTCHETHEMEKLEKQCWRRQVH